MRNISITVTGSCTPDAYKALIRRIEDMEVKYSTNTSSVSDVTAASAVVTGTTPFKIYVFTLTSVMATGTYTAVYAGDAPSNEEYLPIESIDVTPATATIAVADTRQLVVAYTPSDASGKTVIYSTSDATKATVSQTGLVTGVATGSATITIKTPNGKTDTVAITVS
mgnify:FL=1